MGDAIFSAKALVVAPANKVIVYEKIILQIHMVITKLFYGKDLRVYGMSLATAAIYIEVCLLF